MANKIQMWMSVCCVLILRFSNHCVHIGQYTVAQQKFIILTENYGFKIVIIFYHQTGIRASGSMRIEVSPLHKVLPLPALLRSTLLCQPFRYESLWNYNKYIEWNGLLWLVRRMSLSQEGNISALLPGCWITEAFARTSPHINLFY